MKKLFMAFATMLFSVASFSQGLSANLRSTTLEDGTIVGTYSNKPDKYYLKTTDGINYTMTKEGSRKVIYASITPDSSGNKNVVVGDIKYTVNQYGQVKLNLTNNFNSVNATTSCLSETKAQCRQEWACTIFCAAGNAPWCLLAWAADCAAQAVKALEYIGDEILNNTIPQSLTSYISMAQEECRKDWERATGVLE